MPFALLLLQRGAFNVDSVRAASLSHAIRSFRVRHRFPTLNWLQRSWGIYVDVRAMPVSSAQCARQQTVYCAPTMTRQDNSWSSAGITRCAGERLTGFGKDVTNACAACVATRIG